jgi:hypothetical protein
LNNIAGKIERKNAIYYYYFEFGCACSVFLMFDTFKSLNIIYNVIKDKLTIVMHPVCNILDKEPY